MRGIIYCRTNTINNKNYIGQTTNERSRNNNWKNPNVKYGGNLINKAREKYGVDIWDYKILKVCEANTKKHLKEMLDEWEMYYIKELNTKTPNGYNLTDGGDGFIGYQFTNEHKTKLSEKKKGVKLSLEHKRKLSESHQGKKLTTETKKKISESLKGNKMSKDFCEYMKSNWYKFHKPMSEETKRKISEHLKGRHLGNQYSAKSVNFYINGVFVKTFDSIKKAIEITSVSESTVYRILNGTQSETKNGFSFKYEKQ